MRERPEDEPSGVPTACCSWTVTRKPSAASAWPTERPSTPPPTTATVPLRGNQLLELAVLVQLDHDVATAHQLAVDEQLGDGRPPGVGREHLADARIGEDVHRGILGAEPVQALDDLHREAAARRVRRALHEQHHPVLVDRLQDLVPDLLLCDDHEATSVLILSA